MINLYNGNTESEQLNILESLSNILKDFQDLSEKNIVFAGDFNLFFGQKLESAGGNPILKKLAVSKLLELKESLNFCDIWRIRNPKSKTFLFWQRHVSGILQRRLDYLFISNNMQESVKNVEILNALSTDHSPLFCSFLNLTKTSRGRGLWKFNNSLVSNINFVYEMKTLIQKVIFGFENDTYLTDQVKWELLKYEVYKFAINFSKELAQNSRKLQRDLKTKIKKLEQNVINEYKFNEYKNAEDELEHFYDNIPTGGKIRSKYDWYQYVQKSTKYFLNLEKQKAVNGTVKKIIKDHIEITDQQKIQHELRIFYEQLFEKNICNANSKMVSFLGNISLPVINNDFFNLCENDLTEDELLISLKSMQINKTPGNDGLTKEFYEAFWNEIKHVFLKSLKQAREKGKLSISQRQAVIKLIEKKDRDKRYIKNWRPISLLKIDTKIISKALTSKLKKVLPTIICSNQTAYVNKECISESGRRSLIFLKFARNKILGGI